MYITNNSEGLATASLNVKSRTTAFSFVFYCVFVYERVAHNPRLISWRNQICFWKIAYTLLIAYRTNLLANPVAYNYYLEKQI